MVMGNCSPNEGFIKTVPEFGDDFFFSLPKNWENNEKRLEFDTIINANLKSRNEELEFKNKTRLLERTFFLCLRKLKERSFDYKELCDALEEGRENSFNNFQKFPTVMRKNFDFFGESEPFLDIRETKDNDDHCYVLKFRAREKLGGEEEPGKNRKDSFTVYDEVTINVKTVNSQVNDDSEDGNSMTKISCLNCKEILNIRVVPNTKETQVSNAESQSQSQIERKVKEELIAFQELLKNQIFGGEVQRNFNEENASKLESLNGKINEMKVRIDEQQRERNECFDIEIESSIDKIRRMEEEFCEAEEEIQKIRDEEIRKIREERKEYEKETERMRQESLVELQTMINAILKCFELNRKWQMKEDEWGNWLKFLRSEVSAMKQQFMKFETVCIHLNTHGINDEEFIREELYILHNRAHSSFDILCNAYYKVKSLLEENPDRGFLIILQSQISKVCRRILSVLYGIDNAKVDEDLIEIVRSLFSTFDSSDIFYTSNLRDMEKSGNIEKFENVKDPEEYTPKSSTTAEEVIEEPTSKVEEKFQTSDSDTNKSFDGQQPRAHEEGSENHGEPEHECPEKGYQEPQEGSNFDNSGCQKETREDTPTIEEP